MIGNSGFCKIHDNKSNNNRFFGLTIVDGKHTSSHDLITGGNIGVAAVAIEADTLATLVNDKVTGTTTPTRELCCGGTAEIVTVPPGGLVSQSQVNIISSQAHQLLEQKFGNLD